MGKVMRKRIGKGTPLLALAPVTIFLLDCIVSGIVAGRFFPEILYRNMAGNIGEASGWEIWRGITAPLVSDRLWQLLIAVGLLVGWGTADEERLGTSLFLQKAALAIFTSSFSAVMIGGGGTVVQGSLLPVMAAIGAGMVIKERKGRGYFKETNAVVFFMLVIMTLFVMAYFGQLNFVYLATSLICGAMAAFITESLKEGKTARGRRALIVLLTVAAATVLIKIF